MSDFIKVLIVEDEKIPAMYLKSIIEESGEFKVVDIVDTADKTLQSIKKNKPDVIFMDIMINGPVSGAELALKIYTLYEKIKIIFMTAYSDEEMIEYASEAKAFAYLLKPYRPKEITATLSLLKSKSSSRHIKQKKQKAELKNGYIYDFEKKVLTKENEIVKLPPKEMELLEILCHNIKTTVSKDTLLESLGVTDASLRALIYRLRKCLGSDVIVSSKKLGYKIEAS